MMRSLGTEISQTLRQISTKLTFDGTIIERKLVKLWYRSEFQQHVTESALIAIAINHPNSEELVFFRLTVGEYYS